MVLNILRISNAARRFNGLGSRSFEALNGSGTLEVAKKFGKFIKKVVWDKFFYIGSMIIAGQLQS